MPEHDLSRMSTEQLIELRDSCQTRIDTAPRWVRTAEATSATADLRDAAQAEIARRVLRP